MSKNGKLKWAFSAIAFAVLLGCDSGEPVRDIAYYEGLGSEKSLESLRACVTKKKALLEKKDAEGLDQFAKSSQNTNCRTAFKYVMNEEAKSLKSKTPELQTLSTRDEVKSFSKKVRTDTNTKFSDLDPLVEDWRDETRPLGLAIMDFDRQVANRISRIDMDSWRRK